MDIKQQATIVYRAIHTLETLRDHHVVQEDDSTATLFVRESWSELGALLDALCKAGGFKVSDIDAGQHDFPDPRVEAHTLAAWNAGEPIRYVERSPGWFVLIAPPA